MSDPFFNENRDNKDDLSPIQIDLPPLKKDLDEIKIKEKNSEPKKKPDQEKNKKSSATDFYTSRERTIAKILYVAIVICCIITIVGAIWSAFDLFMQTGKLSLFFTLTFGYQMAIIGGFLAGFFFLLIFFIGLSRKGIRVILKMTFKPRAIEQKYQNKFIVKLFAGGVMLSIFAIIIGVIISIIIEVFLGSSGSFSLSAIFSYFESTGPFVLFLGIFLFIMVGMAFALNYLWYNGYYLMLRLVSDLEKED